MQKVMTIFVYRMEFNKTKGPYTHSVFFALHLRFFSGPKMDSMCINESVHMLSLRWVSV